MEWIIGILFLGILSFAIGKFIKHKSLYPFMPFKYDFRKRRDTYLRVMELLDQTQVKVLIETGTSREGLKGAKSNGAATLVYGKWAKINNAILHSVDINPKAVEVAEEAVLQEGLQEFVKLHLSDSVEFLRKFDKAVDFLYLDSYDYSDDVEVQRASQEHHLKEFKAIESKLHKNSIVLIDDCDLPGGGKGKTVIAHMIAKGWRVDTSAYQVILLHEDFGK